LAVSTSAQYFVDRFKVQGLPSGAAANISYATDNTLSLAGANHLFEQVTTIKSSLVAGDYTYMSQPIEGYNFAKLKWGTANAKPLVISFRARVDNVGGSATIAVAVRNGVSNRSYVTNVTVSGTGAAYQVTIPGDTSGTWTTDNSMAAEVSWCMACGSTLQTPGLNAWQAGNYIGSATQSNMFGTLNAVLNITDVQFETDTLVATPYDNNVSIAQTLRDCQRYYEVLALGMDYTNTVGAAYIIRAYTWATTKRTAPVVTSASLQYVNSGGSNVGFTATVQDASVNMVRVGATGLTNAAGIGGGTLYGNAEF